MTRTDSAQNRNVLLIGTLIAAALIALALFAVKNGQGNKTIDNNKLANFNLAGLPFEGQESAPISILVIEDFKCPVCKNFEETVAPLVKQKYIDTGKVKVYSIVWPFLAEKLSLNPDDSKLAAQAAKCVYDQKGNEGFSQFKSYTFRAQEAEDKVWATKSRLKELAANVEGIDQAKFDTCIDTDATAARVDADEKQANDNGVGGTPTIFVNNKHVKAAGPSYTIEDIDKAVEEASKK